MALKKSSNIEEDFQLEEFETIREYINYFYNEDDTSIRYAILDRIVELDNGDIALVKLLSDFEIEHNILTYISMLLIKLDPKDAPIDEIMELLKVEDAFIRNLVVSILQAYGSEIKYYIVKFLIDDDRDLRIFAINILGDVNFSESRDMMLELLEKEEDINVAMTAVDYLAEIGEEQDIQKLIEVKERFKTEPYTQFAIDRAIKMIKG
jgi:HEAT repeat protein